MKAILCEKYGPPDVLQLQEVEKPTPKDNQVLVQVHAASLNISDYYGMNGGVSRFMGNGLRKPKDPRMGGDIAGRVEAVGSSVTQFQPGNEVFGTCAGGFAEYATAREIRLVLKPANSSFEEAAAIPIAAVTALQGLRDKGHVQPGQKVLISGASGGVGTFAVQIAKSFGAEVTAVASPSKLDLLRSIGADHVMDYTREDFTRNGQRFDLILEVNGYHPILDYRRALSPDGIYVMVGASHDRVLYAVLQAMLIGPLISMIGTQKLGFMGIAKLNQKDLVFLKDLLEARKVVPVIDRRYLLSETAEALRYMGEGHARGKIIITMEHNNT
jgi:NADPH:quinone reductase-like Zn-dependent oxidoreductase